MRTCSHKDCSRHGIYGNPTWPICKEFPKTDALIRAARWCEEHRTISDDSKYNDILLEDENERDTTNTRQDS